MHYFDGNSRMGTVAKTSVIDCFFPLFAALLTILFFLHYSMNIAHIGRGINAPSAFVFPIKIFLCCFVGNGRR